MAFCNPKAEISALLCNIPSQWRDSIVEALSCILSLNRDSNATCEAIKDCETLTYFEPIKRSGNTITLSYRDEKGVLYNRSVDLTTVINNILNGVDSSCLMDQEDWEELTFAEKLNAIYQKACCVHGNCTGGGDSGCGCDCEGNPDEPCIGTNACKCMQYIITGAAPYTFSYKDCDTKLVTEYNSIDDNIVPICALKGSLILPLGVLFEETGECGDIPDTTTTTSSSTTTTTAAPTTTTTSTTTTSTSTTTTTTAAPTTTTTTTTTSTTTTTTIAPLLVKISNTLEGICEQVDFFAYTSTMLITPGLILYEDSALTNPVTGYSFVDDFYGSGIVYNLNSGSGLIGSNTGQSC